MSKSATQPKAVEAVVPLRTAILVVKEAPSVIVPPTRLGPCSGSESVSARAGTAQGATASISGCGQLVRRKKG